MHEQLLETVETLRSSNYLRLDPSLVARILELEADALEARSGSGILAKLEQTIDQALAAASDS